MRGNPDGKTAGCFTIETILASLQKYIHYVASEVEKWPMSTVLDQHVWSTGNSAM